MAVVDAAAPAARGLSPGGRFVPVVLFLAWRSLVAIRRLPSAFIPSVLMPIFFVVFFSGAFSAITLIPGFATDNILNWYVPMAILQGAAFAGVGTGFSAARDIEGGFFDRLLLAPAPRFTLLAGALVASTLRALLPFTVVLIVGVIGGMTFPGGVMGVLTLLAAALGLALVGGAWGLGLVYRIQRMSAGPLIQMGIFLAMFLSTAQVPVDVMQGWLKTVARVNPMTQVFDLARQGLIGDVSWGQTWPGLVALAASSAALVLFAMRGLRRLTP